MYKALYRISDGAIVGGVGTFEPVSGDPAYGTAVFGDQLPDPRTARVTGVVINGRHELRAATAPEIAAYDASQNTSRFTATSRQKDILATCALIVRARGIAAWTAMSPQAKKDAVLAEADVWVNIRQFIEDNL
jgi:hypothetical protein